MEVTCISDLHGAHPELSEGDLLIIAGDVLGANTEAEYTRFYHWCLQQKYRKVLFIAGNHDYWIEQNKKIFNNGKVEYLCDSGTVFDDYKIYGTPWSRRFMEKVEDNAFATSDTGLGLAYDRIPHDVDILITHMPLEGSLDQDAKGIHWGSRDLWARMEYCFRPFLHVFGHVHESYGQEQVKTCRDGKVMISVNASIMNAAFEPVNKPIRVIL